MGAALEGLMAAVFRFRGGQLSVERGKDRSHPYQVHFRFADRFLEGGNLLRRLSLLLCQ